MGFFEDTIVKAKEVIDVAGKKTNEIIEVQRLKVSQSSLQSQMSKDYETLGRLVYDGTKAGKKNEDAVDTIIDDIAAKKMRLSALDTEIAKAKGGIICGKCGSVGSAESEFCSRCGSKLGWVHTEPEEPVTETATEPAE